MSEMTTTMMYQENETILSTPKLILNSTVNILSNTFLTSYVNQSMIDSVNSTFDISMGSAPNGLNTGFSSDGGAFSCEMTTIDISSFNFTPFDFPKPETIRTEFNNWDYLKIIACVVTIIFILIGNIGVIAAVACNRSLRNTINYYLANLAVADVLICACCLWVHLVNNLYEPMYKLGPFFCKFNGFAQSKHKLIKS
jgi:hypothetical protein